MLRHCGVWLNLLRLHDVLDGLEFRGKGRRLLRFDLGLHHVLRGVGEELVEGFGEAVQVDLLAA